jgi:hypothetical protein
MVGVAFPNISIAAPIQVEAVVEQSSVYVGEPFILTIRVSGSDQVQQPDLSGIKGVSVKYQGGSQNNSSSITIINGKMTQDVRRGFVFSYQLTPLKTGTLTIPALTVMADGQTVRTRPVHVNVLAPEKTDDVRLRLSISQNQCYVGEPVTLTVTWYLRQDVQSVNFTIPLLGETEWFYFIDPETQQQPDQKYYRIPLNDGEVIAQQGQKTLDGTSFSTITFSKILIPKKSGRFTIEPATVACEILTGYRNTNRRNSFFSSRQGVYKKVVAPSNSLTLDIREVPDQGRPAGFAGHIGTYKISADATPTEVSVGAPITLALKLSGPVYLEHVILPPLTNQKNLVKNFKIPSERATAETRGNAKIFTQTIRALNADVNRIPPIELPYFDTKTGTYKIAETEPIPLTVKETRMITAMDAEGRSLPAVNGNKVQTWEKGIAYNYEDLSVLKDQRTGFALMGSRVWIAGLVLPPILYLMTLLTTVMIRRKQADPQAVFAKKAFSELCRDLKKVRTSGSGHFTPDIILDVLRHYLGARLGISSRAIVFNDVRPLLTEKAVSGEVLDDLKSIFDECEAGRYAGTSGTADPVALSEKTLKTAKKLEKYFK